MIGLLGKKCGMTRVFTEDGVVIPVTVIEIPSNYVTQIKTRDKDGYEAIQVTMGKRKRKRLTKAKIGHYSKAGIEPGEFLHEFRLNDGALTSFVVGQEVNLDILTTGQYVDITGITKGKGYAGTIKRHHFAGQDNSHGNSLSHRVPGSIGQRQSPGKVFKGKKMSGHLGNVKRTIQSQQVIQIDAERRVILIKGAVPGANNALVIIRLAIKKST